MADAVADRQKELDAITSEAQRLQDFYDETDPETKQKRRWDPEDRQRFEDLCEQGAAIQDEIEAEAKWARLEARREAARNIPEPMLPNARSPKYDPREAAGYISVGDAVLMSEAFQKFADTEYATGQSATIQLACAFLGKNALKGPHGVPLVPLTKEMRKDFERFAQSKAAKAVPTLGTGIIEPERLARIPQVTADERLRIRDVIGTGQTGSGSVEYVREESSTNNAEPTAPGETKPEETVEYTLQSASVRTIAGWMPVQNQQLDDWAQLRSLIDGRLRYSVMRAEEQQVLYGDGTGQNLLGLHNVVGIQNIATNGRYNAATHTLIDVCRLGITDVYVAGYEANAIVLHPYDWEEIVLAKGTDNRYVWVVVPDSTGARIWGVPVVEAVGARDRDTGARNILIGDFQMGAQLLDRMSLSIQVGLINAQFVQNMRTILAEERVALPIYAPAAFAHFETVAAGS